MRDNARVRERVRKCGRVRVRVRVRERNLSPDYGIIGVGFDSMCKRFEC